MKTPITLFLALTSLLVIPASQASKFPVSSAVAAAKAERDEAARLVEEERRKIAAAAVTIEDSGQENEAVRKRIEELEKEVVRKQREEKERSELREQQRALQQRASLATVQTLNRPVSLTDWLITHQENRKIEPRKLNKTQERQPQATLNQPASTSYFTRFKNFWYRLFARTQ